jgi:DNA polymerase-1
VVVVDEPVIHAIDGNSLVHRSYHAQARTGLHTADGRPCWAVRGLLMQLVAAVDRIRPTAVVVGFDDPDSSQRRERWPSYKATRVDKLDSLVEQLACAVDVLRQLGVAVVVPPGLEADDVLASTAARPRRWAPPLSSSPPTATPSR